ncbi:MAG TPA: lipid II flippase MurJ [Flavobacteriaceae bacterium]|nr:lipid II flippase MurJ [Flavobacteriaceae bacterium]
MKNLSVKHIITLLKPYVKSATFFNIATVAVITILVKGFGFFKEVVVLGTFGLSELLDTFYIAALVPGFINEVFLISFKSVFVPNYVAEIKTNKHFASFQSTSFLVTVAMGLVFIGIAFLVTDTFLSTFFSGHTASYYSLVKTQFYYLAPCILLWGLISLLGGLLHIDNEFTFSSLHPALTSVAMLICLFFFKEQLQEKVLAVGMLIGCISEFIFLLIVSLKRKIIALGIPDFSSVNARLMFKEFPARVSSSFLTGLIPVTDQFFAAQLIIGSVAALNYGLKVPALISTLFIIALGNVLLPYFSKLIIDNKEEAFRKLFQILKTLFVVLVFICAILLVFSEFIIDLIFERNAFTSEDTLVVSRIQQMFLIGIPFTICGNIIVGFLTSMNKNKFMAYISLITVILNVLLDFILMKKIGIIGIALCTAFLQLFRSVVFLLYTLKQKRLTL